MGRLVKSPRTAMIRPMKQGNKTPERTVVDYAIDALREAIRSGRLVPGQRLVVADVTAMLEVSAGPVREAIRRLTGEGLIEIVPHKGASVRQITPRDLEEIFELRTAVEGLGARLAAERGEPFRSELEALMTEMDRLVVAEDKDGFIANNTQFHNLIYRMSGNDRVKALARQLILPIYQMQLPQRMDNSAMHTSHRDHRVIAAALLAGNGDAAEAAMRRHIENAGLGLREALLKLVPVPRPARERSAD